MSALPSEWQSVSHVVGSLIEVSCDLSSNDQEEAMDLLDTAFHMIRTPSNDLLSIAFKQLHLGRQRTLSQDLREETLAPDMYQEDECDVGPRALYSLLRADAVTCLNQDLALLELFVVFNKAIILESLEKDDEAKHLFQRVVSAVQSILQLSIAVPTNKLLELGMRAHNNLGQMHYIEGDEEMARVYFEAALLFARQLSDLSHDYRLEYASVLSNWCRVNWMRGDISDNLYTGLTDVLRIRSNTLPWNHIDVAAAHYNVGVAEYARQRIPKAITHLRQYLHVASFRNQAEEEPVLDTIPALIHLLLMQNEENDDSASVELVRGLRTLQDKRQDQGPRSSEVASVLNFIGTLLFHKEDFENALLFFQEELLLEETLAEFNEDISVSVTCNNIGRILQELARSHEAIKYYQRALKSVYGDVSKESVGKGASRGNASKACSIVCTTSPDANLYSTVWYNLGLIHDKLGSYGDAIHAFELSLELRKAMLGTEHPDIACLLYNIGVLQMEQQQLNEASFSFREALRIRRVASTGQLNDHQVVKTLEKLASLHKAKGNIKGALEASGEILQILDASSSYDPMTRMQEMGVMLRSIAELHHAIGDLSAAIGNTMQSVRNLQSVIELHDTKDPLSNIAERNLYVEQLVSSLLLLGSFYHEICEPVQACAVFQEAAFNLQQSFAEQQPRRATLVALKEVTLMLATSHCAPQA